MWLDSNRSPCNNLYLTNIKTDWWQSLITDLRTATDFTYTNYIYGISNCEAAPSTDILWVTAEVSGTTYPAADSQIEIHSIAPTIDALYPFPGLVMTNLHQGDVITLVIHQYCLETYLMSRVGVRPLSHRILYKPESWSMGLKQFIANP